MSSFAGQNLGFWQFLTLFPDTDVQSSRETNEHTEQPTDRLTKIGIEAPSSELKNKFSGSGWVPINVDGD